jgi:undecaprenyl-diphosphatase
MVLPLIVGKSLLDVRAIASGEMEMAAIGDLQLILGFLAAFVAGLFACKWMIALVKRANLRWFAIYCFIVGALAALYTII